MNTMILSSVKETYSLPSTRLSSSGFPGFWSSARVVTTDSPSSSTGSMSTAGAAPSQDQPLRLIVLECLDAFGGGRLDSKPPREGLEFKGHHMRLSQLGESPGRPRGLPP